MATISSDLKATVETHPNISEVHFNAEGGFHFNVYPHGGEKYGRILESNIIDPKTNKPRAVRTPLLKTRIVETVSREQILSANAGEEVSFKRSKKNKAE